MTAQNRQYITVDSCVTDYLTESEQSNHKYFKIWQLAFRGMEHLGLDFFYQIRSVKLPVLSNKTVALPANYLNYTKVGVLNSVGAIIPLKYNSNLTTYADLSADRLTKTQDNTIFNWYLWNTPVWYNFWNGDVFINLYGIPSGTPDVGGFKIDNANGIILLDENFGYEYVMLEYISSPMEGQEYYIPVQFREALVAWLAWKDIANIPSKTHVQNSNVGMRRKDYFNERRLANARYRPFYLQEAYEWALQNCRMVVKAG